MLRIVEIDALVVEEEAVPPPSRFRPEVMVQSSLKSNRNRRSGSTSRTSHARCPSPPMEQQAATDPWRGIAGRPRGVGTSHPHPITSLRAVDMRRNVGEYSLYLEAAGRYSSARHFTRGSQNETSIRHVAIAVAATSALMLLGPLSPANAAVVNWSLTVTSGSSTFATAVRCAHGGGRLAVKQTSSEPRAAGRYRLRNVKTGATTSQKAIANGKTAGWNGVAAGTHQLQVRRNVPEDTNGIAPGSGNTTFRGTFGCP